MKENESALYSHYLIDGVWQEMTPADLLDECMEYDESEMQSSESFGTFDDIIDETSDRPVTPFTYDRGMSLAYAASISEACDAGRTFSMLYPDHFTRLHIAEALISRLWSKGHFRLGNLRLWAQWDWNTRPMGNMAAFYTSASAASDYIYSLGVRMSDYLFIEGDGESNARFFAWLPDTAIDEEEEHYDTVLFKSSPYESRHPWIGDERKCPATMVMDEESWLVYIPFDTCPFKLGGSLFAQVNGHTGGPAPQIMDADYFIDCYEVVRELVEDGIVAAGISIGNGGLGTAAVRFCEDMGAALDLSGIMASYQEDDPVRILFGEIPGVLVQIRDNDYDYFDSQMILQDIAYYPLGHPSASGTGITFDEKGKTSVAGILASLLSQTSEGED